MSLFKHVEGWVTVLCWLQEVFWACKVFCSTSLRSATRSAIKASRSWSSREFKDSIKITTKCVREGVQCKVLFPVQQRLNCRRHGYRVMGKETTFYMGLRNKCAFWTAINLVTLRFRGQGTLQIQTKQDRKLQFQWYSLRPLWSYKTWPWSSKVTGDMVSGMNVRNSMSSH